MTATSSDFAAFQANPNRAVGHAPVEGGGYATTYVRDPDAQTPAAANSTHVGTDRTTTFTR